MTRRLTWRVWVVAVIVAAGATAGRGQQAEVDAGPIEPRADEVMKRMGRLLADTKAFSFEAHILQDEVLLSGQKLQLSQIRKAMVQRPDRIRIVSTGDLDNRRVWYRGRSLALLDQTTNEYAVMDVPANIDDTLDHLVERYGLVVPLADIVVSDPYTSAMRNTRVGFYVGLHHVRGVPCHHLAFRQDTLDWQIWIDAGDKPVPRKLLITFTHFPGQPQWTAELSNWDLEPTINEDDFVFHPPADSRKVDPEQLLRQGQPGESATDIGEPAAP